MYSCNSFDGETQWIWGGTEESPRNEWRCFRKTFTAAKDGWKEASLSIAADSRYVLYVNGEQVGRGPVRSWPFEMSYDTYEVGHLLQPGQTNTLAVLVQHYGVSTFYYVRGRGGLLVQLDMAEGDDVVQRIATDDSWCTSRHLGQDARAARMSCQHAFAERIDAGAWDERWSKTGYSDAAWLPAHVLGKVGMSPWETLKPKDIPPLTDETVYPTRVEALSRVVPISWTANLDLRNQMVPGCEDNANEYVYAGYAAVVIRTGSAVTAEIGFPYAPPHFQAVIVNGVRRAKQDLRGYKSERYLTVELQVGDNLLLVELVGKDHGRGLFMGIDCQAEFTLHPPLQLAATGEDGSSFVTIGPFACYEYIDHRFDDEARARHRAIDACGGDEAAMAAISAQERDNVAAFCLVRKAAAAAELEALRAWIRPIPLRFVSRESVVALSMWKRSSSPQSVPASLQQAALATPIPAVVPVYEQADTEFVLDFGRQTVGYITFEVDAEAGTVLDFYGFEHMRDGWVQHMNYLENSLRYMCRQGRQTYTSSVRRGFRYLAVTVRGAVRPVKVYGVQMRQSHYPVAEIGRFQCSDPLLNDIWQISQTTTKLCMEDTFVDCPAYEQTFWVGDSRNEALIAYYLFGGEEMVKRSLELVPGSKRQTPFYADQVPSGWSSVIPNWTFFWVGACREYYERTGDRAFAEAIWPHVAYTLDHYLERIDERGLLFMDAWNFLDWAPIDQPRDGSVAHQNMFLVRALLNAAHLAQLVGEAQAEAKYRDAAESLTTAINASLWSEERQAYLDCIHADGHPSAIVSMQTQVVAYLCDIAASEDERRKRLESCLLAAPSDFVPLGSPFMSFFYYEALAKMGQYGHMVDDMRRQYGQMIDYGATTCWEMYPKRKDGQVIPTELTRSHCHAWSAAPGYFLGAYVLGVKEAAPGWERVTVEPEPCGLAWARGSVPLPEQGRVDVSWRLDESGHMHIEVWAPADVETTVRLPQGCSGTFEVHRIGL